MSISFPATAAPTVWILVSVYLISGFCAALGGVVSLSQLGAVSPNFGFQREFTAIAAAVLGGTSLFGGRRNSKGVGQWYCNIYAYAYLDFEFFRSCQ